ncbi:MAG: transcription repressor NadR [Mogibacterium sp.]|nr:transcription repressor NadR [Mogibacterium sp.]
MITTKERRETILNELKKTSSPIKASLFAEQFGVSRQIIVGDIAILRAAGHRILPTPHGYQLERPEPNAGNIAVIACKHQPDETREELYLVVDNGGSVIDVTVEHPVYGELRGLLNIESRYDADRFCEKLAESRALTLSSITGGIHLHTIRFRDPECLERIRRVLAENGYLLES